MKGSRRFKAVQSSNRFKDTKIKMINIQIGKKRCPIEETD